MPKHTPNTTEPSHPHVGSSGQKEVDMLSFDKDGKKDNEETKKNSHVTDPNIVQWGREKQDADAKKAEEKEED
jgi:hypothetical protein